MNLRLAELCAGYGGLGLGLAAAGVDVGLVWWSEIDPHANTVMSAHTTAPNLGDLTELEDVPRADIVTAGFPCQPVSGAGQRKGIDDDRWLIDDVCRVAARSGARTLVLENVSGLLTANSGRALGAVCRAMAQSGFRRWEWGVVRASDIGAPHQRARWFCVAHADGQGQERTSSRISSPDPDSGQPERRGDPRLVGSPPPTQSGEKGQRERARHPTSDRGSIPAPDTDCWGRQGKRLGQLSENQHPLTGDDLDRRLRPRFGGYATAIARWELILGRPVPDPTIDGRLSDRFVEWMMGLPLGWVCDTGLTRRQALAVLGNGVVPLQAAAAISWLSEGTP